MGDWSLTNAFSAPVDRAMSRETMYLEIRLALWETYQFQAQWHCQVWRAVLGAMSHLWLQSELSLTINESVKIVDLPSSAPVVPIPEAS
jgi:hypothetical protein